MTTSTTRTPMRYEVTPELGQAIRLRVYEPLGRSRQSQMTTVEVNTEQPKVLVVDDDEEIRTTLISALTFNEFKVTTAGNVGEALHLIDTQQFDVLLSLTYTCPERRTASRW